MDKKKSRKQFECFIRPYIHGEIYRIHAHAAPLHICHERHSLLQILSRQSNWLFDTFILL